MRLGNQPHLLSLLRSLTTARKWRPAIRGRHGDSNNLTALDSIGKVAVRFDGDWKTSERARTTVQARDHVVAERKRRENLSQLFIGLSKVVPGLKKLDKASVLEDAIDHLKELQERVRVLEEEMSVTNFINTPTNDYYSSSSNEDKFTENSNSGRASSESGAAEIKARINSDNQHVLINIQCKKQKGLMSRVPRQLEKMHLSVVDMRIMPFGGQALLHITLLAQMQSEFSGTLKDIVEHLQQRLFVHPQQQDKPC
ncbi:transcription factor bhlh25 [Phtheirospermum japonicum]|uniref:Transcription factor bhlh25 n=1 Tax=Phtheirospermum japonicum TaxID=374723 RepID=A0A830CMS7_9LAMI|nr:transcription factor bhlh25 [Phtheirospermum japonicum]